MSFSLGSIMGCAATGVTPEQQREALALVDQGTGLLRNGKFDQARASYEMAERIGRVAAAVDGLGCVAFLTGDYLAAEADFARAYAMDAEYDTPLTNLALLYEVTGRYSLARSYYERAVAAGPDNVRARSNFAAFLAEHDSRKGVARGQFLDAQAILDHPIIRQNLLRLQYDSE